MFVVASLDQRDAIRQTRDFLEQLTHLARLIAIVDGCNDLDRLRHFFKVAFQLGLEMASNMACESSNDAAWEKGAGRPGTSVGARTIPRDGVIRGARRACARRPRIGCELRSCRRGRATGSAFRRPASTGGAHFTGCEATYCAAGPCAAVPSRRVRCRCQCTSMTLTTPSGLITNRAAQREAFFFDQHVEGAREGRGRIGDERVLDLADRVRRVMPGLVREVGVRSTRRRFPRRAS